LRDANLHLLGHPGGRNLLACLALQGSQQGGPVAVAVAAAVVGVETVPSEAEEAEEEEAAAVCQPACVQIVCRMLG
jgi:hypothetical protein